MEVYESLKRPPESRHEQKGWYIINKIFQPHINPCWLKEHAHLLHKVKMAYRWMLVRLELIVIMWTGGFIPINKLFLVSLA